MKLASALTESVCSCAILWISNHSYVIAKSEEVGHIVSTRHEDLVKTEPLTWGDGAWTPIIYKEGIATRYEEYLKNQ